MRAYIVALIKINNIKRYMAYKRRTPNIVKKHGGKFIVRSKKLITLEGKKSHDRIVIIEFPSLFAAIKWYKSKEYQKIKKLRMGASTLKIIATKGYFH